MTDIAELHRLKVVARAQNNPATMEALAKLAKLAAIVALPAAAWYVLLAPSKQKKKAHRSKKTKKKKESVAAAQAPASVAPPAPAPAPAPASVAAAPDPVRVPKAPPPRHKPKPRARPRATTSAPAAFSEGDRVEARFGGGEDYFPATVTGSKPLGGGKYSYALAYDDGAKETGIAATLIRRVGGTAAQAAPTRPAAPTAPAPQLDGLVAYSKDGATLPAAAPRTSHRASLTAKARPRSRDDDDDDDDDAFDPVQSVDDWKKAAPKPRRPAIARPDISVRKAAQAERNEVARKAEANRRKKEKAKAKKLAVREHFRQAL